MLRCLLFFPLLWLACQGTPSASSTPPADADAPPLTMTVSPVDTNSTEALFGKEPVFTVLFGGMEWAEGPLVLPDGSVICSDVPKNQVLRWTGSGSSVYLEGSGGVPNDYSGEPGSNGLHLDAAGRLLLCQHGARRIARMDAPLDNPQPVFVSVADNYEGKRFNSPNDLVVAADGSILFTDPTYGLPGQSESPLRELDFQGVFRIRPDGSVQLLSDAYAQPNGIGLSPDGKTLYVADSDRSRLTVTATQILDENYNLGQTDTLINARSLVGKAEGSTDGLAVAKNGRIFATAPGGVWVIEPDGRLLSKISTGQRVANVELAPGEDYLYLTSDYYLIRLKLF